jgi:hypothetical protein
MHLSSSIEAQAGNLWGLCYALHGVCMILSQIKIPKATITKYAFIVGGFSERAFIKEANQEI